MRLLPGWHLPDRGGSIRVHELWCRVCVKHGGRRCGKCVRGMRVRQLLGSRCERLLELRLGPVLGRLRRRLHGVLRG